MSVNYFLLCFVASYAALGYLFPTNSLDFNITSAFLGVVMAATCYITYLSYLRGNWLIAYAGLLCVPCFLLIKDQFLENNHPATNAVVYSVVLTPFPALTLSYIINSVEHLVF